MNNIILCFYVRIQNIPNAVRVNFSLYWNNKYILQFLDSDISTMSADIYNSVMISMWTIRLF